MTRSPVVIAHRGASGYLPENTLPAFRLAVEQQADWIEIDLHLTQDERIAITHDESLDGIGGQGEIADIALQDLRALDAGGGEPVPTLAEVLDEFGHQIPFNLELKRSTRGAYEGLEQATLDAVESRGLLPGTLFSSFYDPVLATLRTLSPSARLALLISRRFPDRWAARAAALGAEALNPEDALVDAALVEKAHGEGLAVYVYTVDDPERMKQLIDLGVNGIFTNRPERMRTVLASLES